MKHQSSNWVLFRLITFAKTWSFTTLSWVSRISLTVQSHSLMFNLRSIIFVHDLKSNSDMTWSISRNLMKTASQDDVCWIIEWHSNTLAKFSQNIRVFFYNYDSYWKRNAIQTRLSKLEVKLEQDSIFMIRKMNQTRALVFVTHCYDDFVVKQMRCNFFTVYLFFRRYSE